FVVGYGGVGPDDDVGGHLLLDVMLFALKQMAGYEILDVEDRWRLKVCLGLGGHHPRGTQQQHCDHGVNGGAPDAESRTEPKCWAGQSEKHPFLLTRRILEMTNEKYSPRL